MRFASQAAVLILAACAALDHRGAFAAAKKPSSRSSSGSRRPSSSRSGPSSRSSGGGGRPPVSSRRRYDDEEECYEGEEEFDFDDPFDEEEEDEYEPEEPVRRPSRSSSSRKGGRPSSRPAPRKRPSGSRGRQQHDDYDDYDHEHDRPRRTSSGGRGPGPRPSSRNGPPRSRGGRGSVVPYTNRKKPPSTFTRGLQKLKSSMPDPAAVKNAAVNSLNAARETTSNLSSNVYREVKGLTSSELEQVMLKATRPDDTAVKGKHAERLVGVTYQISARYDIYDAVLRKLWSKMAEKDWRTTIKALYILHRFSADGAPEHAPSLKARLRELRRTRDPKRKKKFYNSEQLLAGDSKEETAKFRAFMSRYAHYVLLRVQCFGGMFDEIALEPGKDGGSSNGKKKKSSSSKSSRSSKPITSTCLRVEHLDASALLLKAGIGCQLKNGEECENTAIAAERVASDLIGLTSAVAKALNRALEPEDDDDEEEAPVSASVDADLIRRWCEFYSEDLLPQTRSMVKRTTPKLDAFGLFLPSRMGTTVSQDALQRGLKLEGSSAPVQSSAEDDDGGEEEEEESADAPPSKKVAADDGDDDDEEEEQQPPTEEGEVDEVDDGEEVYDEYEYDVEEYYDDEDSF